MVTDACRDARIRGVEARIRGVEARIRGVECGGDARIRGVEGISNSASLDAAIASEPAQTGRLEGLDSGDGLRMQPPRSLAIPQTACGH